MYFQTTKDFRDYLYNLLKDYLGVMTLASGATVPSIFVGEPPPDSRFEGLEVNIPKFPSGSQTWLTGGTAPNRKFEFYLVQHPSSTQQDFLIEATDLVAIVLTPCSYQFIASVRDPSGQQLTLDQVVFSFTRSALFV